MPIIAGNNSDFPSGQFTFFYSDNKQPFMLDILSVEEPNQNQIIFDKLWAKVNETLLSNSIILQDYNDFFKECTKALVDYSLNKKRTESWNLNSNEMIAFFSYNQKEKSKSFNIKTPDINGNRAWIKFYQYCDQDDY